jgi:hypothetical protein
MTHWSKMTAVRSKLANEAYLSKKLAEVPEIECEILLLLLQKEIFVLSHFGSTKVYVDLRRSTMTIQGNGTFYPTHPTNNQLFTQPDINSRIEAS